MISQPVIETIKTTVHSIIPDARIILFGSMAKGTDDKGSDYDLLIISKNNIPNQEKSGWRIKLDKALFEVLDTPVDLVLNSEAEVERKKDLLGHVVRWAVLDGVEL